MPKAKSSPGQRSRLVAVIREHKILYDSTHPSYSDSEARNKVWVEVAEQCGIKKAENAKIMWKQVRDSYRMFLKKPDENNSSYTLYQLMKFIDPHVVHRKRKGKQSSVRVLIAKTNKTKLNNDAEAKSNKDQKNGEDLEAAENTTHVRQPKPSNKPTFIPLQSENNNTTELISNNEAATKSNEDFNAGGTLEPEFTTIQYWDDAEDNTMATEIPEPMTEDIPKNNAPMIPASLAETHQDSNSESEEMESYEDVLPEALNNGTVDTSLKMFFDAMYASTSQLSPNLQRLVKKNIFSTILEAEEQFDNEQKMTAAAEPRPNHFRIKREL